MIQQTSWQACVISTIVHFRHENISSVVIVLIIKQTRRSRMLTANCCLTLIWLWHMLHVVCNGDFNFCVSVCQLAPVYPGYDCELPY